MSAKTHQIAEAWAPLPGYEGLYKVLQDRSSGVVVWSVDREINGNINISNNGALVKKRMVKARLVRPRNGRYRLNKNRHSQAVYLADDVYDAAFNKKELIRLERNGG